MNDLKMLEELRPTANELFSGLTADEAMRQRIRREARQNSPARPSFRLVPTVCSIALVAMLAFVFTPRLTPSVDTPQPPAMVRIASIPAGSQESSDLSDFSESAALIADLGNGASVKSRSASTGSLFESRGSEFAVVSVDGAVYRLLETPADIGASLLGAQVGCVSVCTDTPSLASAADLSAGLSNVCAQGTAVYAVGGLSSQTAVAAKVDGRTRVFQRVSFAGRGPGSGALENTLDIRGKVRSLELSGVGVAEGETAAALTRTLLDSAQLVSADATARKQFLTITLTNGLRLQLGVSGDTFCACGGWSCPEFFEAFEAAL